MPRRKRRKSAPDLSMETAFAAALSDAFVKPFFRLPKILISDRPLRESFAENIPLIVLDTLGALFILGLIVYLYVTVHWLRFALVWLIGFAGVMFIPAITVGIVRRHRRSSIPVTTIDRQIRKALDVMDSTAKWYDEENEANRELVNSLKLQGVPAEYQYVLPNGRIADAKVGDILIEGKLSPNTRDVDGLLGQLTEYTQYDNRVIVVIYGRLTDRARRRIQNEIRVRHLNRVSLIYLSNPKRHRANEQVSI